MNKKTKRYWLRVSGLAWQEATQEQFIQAERGAGFRPKVGNGIATGSFSSGSIQGRITYGEVTQTQYPTEQDFVALANKPSVLTV